MDSHSGSVTKKSEVLKFLLRKTGLDDVFKSLSSLSFGSDFWTTEKISSLL